MAMSLSKKTIYVTGHRNPDSDSIISSMAYAYLKQQLGYNAIAVRIGELNQETKYILQMFNEFAPPLASDIRTRIRDIDFDEVVTCGPHDNLQKCLDILNDNNAKVIIVVDEHFHAGRIGVVVGELELVVHLPCDAAIAGGVDRFRRAYGEHGAMESHQVEIGHRR